MPSAALDSLKKIRNNSKIKKLLYQPVRIHAEIAPKFATIHTITSFFTCINGVKTIQYRLFWVKTAFLSCVHDYESLGSGLPTHEFAEFDGGVYYTELHHTQKKAKV